VWDEDKGENTKWELKNNSIVIERKVLDKLRTEIELLKADGLVNMDAVLSVIDRYRNEVNA
jgi:hypothetical protein